MIERLMPLSEDVPEKPAMELARGTDVGGYEIECKLGVGGMSVVYGAVHPRIGKRVAIKVLSRTFDDPSAVVRFEQEARLINEIRHPNIVDVFQFGELPDGRSFFVMEWLDGETLGARLKRGPLPALEALAICKAVCDALEAAHERSVVHRDLKPDNVFLVAAPRRQVKLLDFGLAKLTVGKAATSIHNTSNGILVGTPAYMAPEQARLQDVDGRTDIYALGCLMFKMLTGKLPFSADNPVDILVQHLNVPPPSAAKLADVPRELSDLVQKMMAKSPADRPSLVAIREVLARVRGGARSRGWYYMLAAIGLTSGAAIAIVLALLLDRGQSTPRSALAPSPSAPVDAGTDGSAIAQEPTLDVDSSLIEIEANGAAKTSTPPPPIDAARSVASPRPGSAHATTTRKDAASPAKHTNPEPATSGSSEDGIRWGALVISLDSPSEISINGTVRATDSHGGRFELRPGKYRLRIAAPGRAVVDREVEIKTAETTTMSISAGSKPVEPASDAGVP